VFSDKGGMSTGEVNVQWAEIKAQEQAAKKAAREQAGRTPAPGRSGALAGVSTALPTLTRALKLQQKAGKVSFDWNDPKAVLAKIREEADEIGAELDAGHKDTAEIGDLMFAVVNLARHLDVDPDAALRATNLKFERRFASIEDALAAVGKTPTEATLAEDARRDGCVLDRAKAAEKEARS
jgi:ATP diphosphatase